MIRVLTPLLTAALLLLGACASPSLPEGDPIGEPMAAQAIVHFSVVDAEPAKFFDRTVLVEAQVVKVCQTAGCWMQVEDEGATALVRWETGCGGKFAFPKDAAGRRILIQGSFYPKELSPEDRAHMAEEAGGELEIREDPYEFNASAVMLLDEE